MIRSGHSGYCLHVVTLVFVWVILSRPTNVFSQDQDSKKTQQETNVEKSASASPFRLELQGLFELMMVPGVDEIKRGKKAKLPESHWLAAMEAVRKGMAKNFDDMTLKEDRRAGGRHESHQNSLCYNRLAFICKWWSWAQ